MTVTLGGTHGPRELPERHTQCGCEGARGWELLLPWGGGADGGADCSSGGVPESPCTWAEQELLLQRQSSSSIYSLHSLYMKW